MADNTHIEWTDATWNPITGCSVVSPGCTNCYAMKLAGTRLRDHPSRSGLTVDSKAGPVWNGEVRFNEQWLDQPLAWKRQRRIFVCAHGDLFHDAVRDEWIDDVFAVMAAAEWHTFQVLTKRPARMREYLADEERVYRICAAAHKLKDAGHAIGKIGWSMLGEDGQWPLPNVWLGVSVEDQARADERIPILLDTPAAVRWISAEPLLGPVNLRRLRIAPDHHTMIDGLGGYALERGGRTNLDWVVVGGESGAGARPMHPNWARALRDQCAGAGVPFLFKQWGNWAPESSALKEVWRGSNTAFYRWDDSASSIDVGKKAAGRLLDGIEHNGYPEVCS